jgi:hypothetical protein
MSTMSRTENADTIARFIEHTAIPAVTKKDCKNAHDFGGPDTVGLHVKRIGTSIEDSCEDAFGRYLGEHPYGFAVLVTHIDYRPKAVELFDTLEELKQQWQLD